MKIIITICLALLVNLALAQTNTNFWQDIDENNLVLPREASKDIKATKYRALALDLEGFRNILRQAPMEFTRQAAQNPLLITLPLPDGKLETFEIVESPIMESELATRYPHIKTYKGVSISNGLTTVRLGITGRGFHAAILAPQGDIYIDPLIKNQTQYYQAYYTHDAIQDDDASQFSCGVTDTHNEMQQSDNEPVTSDQQLLQPRSGVPVVLYRYRLAIATSGEFAQRFGATTKAQVMDVVVNILNIANGIFERDVAIRLMLINNTDNVFYLNTTTDPFVDGSSISDSYAQVPAILNANIGIDNYDIGHGFIAGCGGGVVGIGGGRACNNNTNNGSFKGFGASCFFDVNTSSVEVYAHETGHQFSAQHTWSNCPGSEGQLASGSAYEPGAGSTVMSYSNACGDQNFQTDADAYFHTKSLEEIISYSRTGVGAGCATKLQTDNNEPEVTLDYPFNFYIPISTPFELTATATDENGDNLTYCWEQFDLGPLSAIGSPNGNAPSFRSFAPNASPTRVFPRLQNIINNTSTNVEVLPTYDRDLTFRCTVRDNHPGAGVSVWQQAKFRSTSSAGPFLVLHPNEDTVKWTGGSYAQVRWDVAKTNNNLVNCKSVNIKLSLDGGLTYPITLVEAAPNNGSSMIPVPDVASVTARIRVEAADNIFFDISNQNFQIQAATQAAYTLNVAPRTVQKHCLPEPLQFNISSQAFLGFNNPISLEIIDTLPDDVQVSLSKTSILPSEGAILTINFTKQIEGTFNIQVKGTANGGQSISIPVSFSTISNDFSASRMLAPSDGQGGIVLSTTFRWNKLTATAKYDFELATSPAFGATVITSAFGLQDTTFTPSIFFEENQLYFWRIRPYNEDCGDTGEFLEPFAFHTATVQCQQTQSTNIPVNISGSGLPTINSTLNVTTQGTISDINIPLIKANYQPVKSLRVSLISPAGTEVNLFDQNCGNTIKLETGFDDDSPTAIICPPDDKMVVRPVQALSAFNGENTAGTWTLRVKVVTGGFGGGGALEGWGVEFCSTFAPSNPFVVKNDTLFVPPALTNTFTINELEIQDTDNTPAELIYTLVTLPQHGVLKLNNVNLQVGNTFTQLDVNNLRLKYTHNGDDSINDGFAFVVQDGTGGFLATQRANIKIDENATVGTNEILNENNVQLFPNPARDMLNIRLNKAPKGSLILSLYNIQGQELLRQRFDQAINLMEINISSFASGMYFVVLRSEGEVLSQKVSIQR